MKFPFGILIFNFLMQVIALALTDQNNAIGRNHVILEYLPAYASYLEKLTRGYPVVMGRLTFEAIGHVLKGRQKVIVTRSEKYHSSNARTYATFTMAMEGCRRYKKIFVIGGAELFRQAMPYTGEIYRTCVRARFRADDYFPEIDTSEFELVESECIKADLKNRFDYCVERWERTDKPKEI